VDCEQATEWQLGAHLGAMGDAVDLIQLGATSGPHDAMGDAVDPRMVADPEGLVQAMLRDDMRARDRVLVVGLRNRKDLNGKLGTLGDFDPGHKRWEVCLDVGDKKPVLVRPENLVPEVMLEDFKAYEQWDKVKGGLNGGEESLNARFNTYWQALSEKGYSPCTIARPSIDDIMHIHYLNFAPVFLKDSTSQANTSDVEPLPRSALEWTFGDQSTNDQGSPYRDTFFGTDSEHWANGFGQFKTDQAYMKKLEQAWRSKKVDVDSFEASQQFVQEQLRKL